MSLGSCPRCAQALLAQTAAGLTVQTCTSCGGLWLDPAAARRLAQSVEAAAHARRLAEDAARRAPFGGAGPQPSTLCPACGAVMHRILHGPAGVVVDVCGAHGTWFDRGELQRILDVTAARQQPGGPFRSAAPIGEVPVELPPEARPPEPTPLPDEGPTLSQELAALFELLVWRS